MSASTDKFESEKPDIDLKDDFTEHQMPARQSNTLHPSKLAETEPGQQCSTNKESCESEKGEK